MNTINELRKMAEEVLSKRSKSLKRDEWGGNFKKLLEELSIYQIELEHQNKELERIEHKLSQAHEEYVRLFESTPVGYVILDENRNIIHANKTFINYFVSASLQNTQLTGVNFDTFITDVFKNAFILFCKMALKQQIPIPVELKLLDRHNLSHYVLLTARVYDSDEKQIALTISDISIQKKMEEQLARAKDEAEETDRKKSRFLTNVSHELRTPLSSIIGYGSLLEDPKISDEERRDYCQNIVVTCKMLLHFSDDILGVSTLESGEVPIRNKVVKIDTICNEMSRLLTRKHARKNILLKTRVENIPMLWTDPLRLTQVIQSVLEHAIGNATEGEILFSCTYRPETEKSGRLSLVFSGKDIFSSDNDFDQDTEHTEVLRTNSRLGLFFAQRIIKKMHGVMIFEHPLERLKIEFPVELSPYQKTNESETSSAKDPNAHFTSGQGKQCLLVDDVAMNLNVLGMMLKKLGYEPIMAMSGEEAIKLVHTHNFNLIMTDLWMPKMNGEKLAINLRQNPKLDDVPIYAVTADVENSHNFDMSFFSGTIVKPVSLEKLRKLLIETNNSKN